MSGCAFLKDIDSMSTAEAASEILSGLTDQQLCLSTILYNVSPNCFTWWDFGYTDSAVCRKLASAAVYETERRGRYDVCDAYLNHHFDYSLVDASRFRSLEYSEILPMVPVSEDSFFRAMNQTGEFAPSSRNTAAESPSYASSVEPFDETLMSPESTVKPNMIISSLESVEDLPNRAMREPKRLWVDESGGDFIDIQEDYIAFVNVEPSEWFTPIFESANKGRPILFCIGDANDKDSISGDCVEGNSGYQLFSEDGINILFFENTLLQQYLIVAEQRLTLGHSLKFTISDMTNTFYSLFVNGSHQLNGGSIRSELLIQKVGQPNFNHQRFGIKPIFEYISSNGQPTPIINIPSSNRSELFLQWECLGSYIFISLTHPWFAGNSSGKSVVTFQFDDQPPSPAVFLDLASPEVSSFDFIIMEKFTRRALAAEVLTLAITDPADGQTVIGNFLLEGLGAHLEQFNCRFVRR